MKSKSENFRQSSIVDIIKLLNKKKIKVLIYEPLYSRSTFMGKKVIKILILLNQKQI